MEKKCFSKLGFSLLISGLLTFIVPAIMTFVFILFNPSALEHEWFFWMLLGIGSYLFAFPFFWFSTRNLEHSKPDCSQKLLLRQWVMLIFIGLGALFLFYILGNCFIRILEIMAGRKILNPLLTFQTFSIYSLVFGCILAPIVEELMFRKILIDRIHSIGDAPAVCISAFLFALYHMNPSQFFYSLALGCLFAIVYVKTGRIFYSIILHSLLNLLGSFVLPAIFHTVIWPFYFLIFIAVLLFIINRNFFKLDFKLPTKEIYLNKGMLSYIIFCSAVSLMLLLLRILG